MELQNEEKLLISLQSEITKNQKEETLLLEEFISHHCSELNFNAPLYANTFTRLLETRIPFKEN